MDALLRPVVSARADTAIYQRVDSAWSVRRSPRWCRPSSGSTSRSSRSPDGSYDRTSEDGSVEARSKQGQMQRGRPAVADSLKLLNNILGALAARLDASKRDEIKASLAFGKTKNARLSKRLT